MTAVGVIWVGKSTTNVVSVLGCVEMEKEGYTGIILGGNSGTFRQVVKANLTSKQCSLQFSIIHQLKFIQMLLVSSLSSVRSERNVEAPLQLN